MISDHTTRSRLAGWIDELKQMLRHIMSAGAARTLLGNELKSFGSWKTDPPEEPLSSG